MYRTTVKYAITESGRLDLYKLKGVHAQAYTEAHKKARGDQYRAMAKKQPTDSELVILNRKNNIKRLHEVF